LGSTPLRRKAVSAKTSPIEKALLVNRWQAVLDGRGFAVLPGFVDIHGTLPPSRC
jgi:imidazolonepropionase-like amidohydrolase